MLGVSCCISEVMTLFLSLSLLVLVTLFSWVESEYWMLSYFFVFVFVAILAKMLRRACVFLGRRKVAN
jgi:uncharacterized membrane protein